MSAAALLSKQKDPTDADIDAAMSGNICRCGTYQRIRAAIKLAAARMRKGPDDGDPIGPLATRVPEGLGDPVERRAPGPGSPA